MRKREKIWENFPELYGPTFQIGKSPSGRKAVFDKDTLPWMSMRWVQKKFYNFLIKTKQSIRTQKGFQILSSNIEKTELYFQNYENKNKF